jgi:hypothetical protein
MSNLKNAINKYLIQGFEFDILIKTMPVSACLRTQSKLDTHKQHPVSERNFTKKEY